MKTSLMGSNVQRVSDVFASTLTGILNEFHQRATKQELSTKGNLEGGAALLTDAISWCFHPEQT